MKKNIFYSVVVPAHNESRNLRKLVLGLKRVLSKTGKKFEIIIVNDNSTDDSLIVLKELKKSVHELIIVNRTSNPGVGNAIREGLNNVRGDIIITMDADLSHAPEEIPKFLNSFDDSDMICGSRYTKGGKADMTYSRILISGLFNLIFRKIIGIKVKDFTSGYRAYKSKVPKAIKLNSKKFGIYIEIPIKAHLAGFKLKEIPISYHKREFGSSNLNYFKQGPEYLKVVFEGLRMKFRR